MVERRHREIANVVVSGMVAMMVCFSSLTTAFVFGAHRNQGRIVTSTTAAVSGGHRDPRVSISPSSKLNSMSNYLNFDNTGESGMAATSAASPRPPIVAGNWKLNPATVQEATALLKLLASNFVHHRDTAPEVVVFPPFPYLERAVALLEGTGIQVGAQNVGIQSKGAFTGEVSPSMVRSLGCSYVLVGHSERRTLYGETDELVNAKIQLSLEEDSGLSVILCVGETLDEYDDQLLESVVQLQVTKALKGVSASDVSDRIIIAYEPVWAIGTGKVATPRQAQAAHEVIRATLEEMYGTDVAQSVRIQYGGSVTPDSIEELMAMPDVDGALVGGASLTADGFSRIVDGACTVSDMADTLSQSSPEQFFGPKELTALEVVSCKNVLGESPVWSVKDQALYWISAPEEEVWAWNLVGPPYRRLFGTTIGCIGLKASNEGGKIIIAGERAFLETTMSTSSGSMDDFSSFPTVLCDRPEQTETTRPNDGRVDREGRMVVGMYNNYHRSGASEGANNCGLYRLCPATNALESLFPPDYQYRVSNCICFSPDGRTMYFCDTPTRKVYAFDYPRETGQFCSNRRLVWTMPPNLAGGPDGAQVDAEGGLWMALSGAGIVVRVHPDRPGVVDYVVHLPVSSPTSCTFGGPNLDELFITTRGPDGGGLYRVKMPFGIRGMAEPEFGGETATQQETSAANNAFPQSPPAATPVYTGSNSAIGSYLDTL